MAVYALINSGKPILNGAAMCRAPQDKATQGVIMQPTDGYAEALASDANAAVLDGRYKVGGSTGWERPGSNDV